MAGYTYTKINWENEPSYNTPINETNLNHMDQGIFDLAYVKAEKTDAVFVNSISLDRKAGTAVGLDSVAAGYDTEATGPSSVAIGTNTSAKNGQAVAGGYNSKALGNTSLAFGNHCITRLNSSESAAIGNNCIAGSANQMVFGQYNVEDTTGTYAEIVGNGSSGNESNARTLDWQGNETIAGDFTNGNGETLHGIYEALPVDTESGNPTVITDAFGGACKSLKLTLEPIQSGSGTPSPQNVRPISGRTQSVVTRTGSNIWDEETIVSSSRLASKNPIKVSGNTTYRFICSANVYASVDQVRANGAYIDFIGNVNAGETFITPASAEYIKFTLQNTYGTTYNNDVAISPSVFTEYAPYNGESITIQLGQTVYGGVLDVTSGVLTDKRSILSENDFDTISNRTSSGGLYWLDYVFDTAINTDILCNMLPKLNGDSAWASTSPCFSVGYSSPSIFTIRLYVSESTLASFKTTYAGLQICYPVHTPTTVQLTPTQIPLLHGNNALTTDADSIETSYSADIALYIDKKIAEGSQGNRSLSKGGSSDEELKEEVKEEEIEIKEEEPLTKEVR